MLKCQSHSIGLQLQEMQSKRNKEDHSLFQSKRNKEEIKKTGISVQNVIKCRIK